MTRLIDADILVKKAKIVEYSYSNGLMSEPGVLLKDIEAQPSVDAEPVRYGKWIGSNDEDYFANCSECGYQMDVHREHGYFNYCPYCGARMAEAEW